MQGAPGVPASSPPVGGGQSTQGVVATGYPPEKASNQTTADRHASPIRGEPLPEAVVALKPNVILAADCVYFEPAFPLLQQTLSDLLALNEDATVYFCFKKRRRADPKFMKKAQKMFHVEQVVDEDRPVFSRESLFLYSFRSKKTAQAQPKTLTVDKTTSNAQ